MGRFDQLLRGNGGGFLGTEAMAALTPNGNGNGKAKPAPAEAKAVEIDRSLFWLGAADTSEMPAVTARKAALTSYVLYAVTSYRAQKLVEAPLWVYREDENGDLEYVPHDVGYLFDQPNPDDDGDDFLRITSILRDIDGECVWHKVKDNGERTRFLRIYHKGEYQTEPGPDDDGNQRIFGRYRIVHSTGSETYGPEDVVHWRYPHPWNRASSLSPADAVMGQLAIADELQTRIRSAIRRMAAPGGFFVRPVDAGHADDAEFARAKAEVSQQYQSTSSGTVGLLEGGMEYVRTAWSLKDIEFGNLYREVEAAVCAVFNVRPEVLGSLVGLENAPWSHMETARRLVYEDAVVPLWTKFGRTLTRQLLRGEDPDKSLVVRFDTTNVPALQEDVERQARIAQIAGDDLSINERRQMIGKEPIDGEEFDVVRGRSENRTQPQPQPGTASGPAPREAKEDKQDERTKFWQKFDAFAEEHEREWRKAVEPLLEADRKMVLSLFKETVKAGQGPHETKDDDIEPSPDQIRRFLSELSERTERESEPRWEQLARRLIAGTGESAIEEAARTYGVSFEVMIAGLESYTNRHAAALVTEVTDTTKDAIRQHLRTGLTNGESIGKLRQRIEEAGAFQPSRAELIARTESTAVTNGAQREGMQTYQRETGRTVMKTWLSSRDGRVREEHEILDGEQVGVDGTFSNGLTEPNEPNCRCGLTYSVSDPIRGESE